MEEDLVSWLRADAALWPGATINWNARDRAAGLPALVLRVITRNPDYTLGGPSGLAETRLQADCYGATYLAARTLARAVEARLSGQRFIHGATRFSGVFMNGSRDDFMAEANGADKIHRVMLDFNVWHAAAS
jgi:hypothetical protein